MKTINILSASDRFNYGDLLFPIICIKELSKHGDFSFNNIALKKTNLKKIGALKTHPYSKLTKKNNNNFTIIAGGDIFSVDWASAYSFLNYFYNKLYWRVKNKKFLNKATKLLIGYPKIQTPFIPTANNISPQRIIYHSVGGNPEKNSKILEYLVESPYLTLREKNSFSAIKEWTKRSDLLITPDSAIIMSEFFNFNKSQEEYIAFQVGHYSKEIPIIIDQLKKIQQKTGLKIKLIPIGNCIGHNDIISLEKIKNDTDLSCDILINPTVESIMKSIANSKFFFGTSLHGIITAMSFKVPYAGMNPQINKLKNYLDTWAPDIFKKIIDFDKIEQSYFERIQTDNSVLLQNYEHQKSKCENSFKRIAQIIQQDK